ncbi:hypothetical protein ABT093_20000 [Kitasatospora sp. NPDC002551]|uniref:hypothetical protein n=1 Tax=Kitasatospora sp. NPDC002551 TaxID=3154539 RepID=UPI00331EA1B9
MTIRRILRARHRRGDKGALSLFVAVAAASLFLVVAFVYDGSLKLSALNHAESAAQEAARAGAQSVNPGRVIAGEGITIDRNAAQAAALAYLKSAGTSGTVSWSGDSIVVSVTETYSPVLWPSSSTVTGRGSATMIVQGG